MLASSSRVDNFLLSGQNVTCTHGFVLVIGTARTRHRKSIAFPANVTRSPPPPVFEERAWVRGYYYSAIIFTLKSLTFISCGYTVWGYVLMLKLIELSK